MNSLKIKINTLINTLIFTHFTHLNPPSNESACPVNIMASNLPDLAVNSPVFTL